jgi:hypothetical protein
MANKKISELPYINGGKLSGNTLVPLVTYFSATTGDTVHTYITDLQNYLTSGITASGNYLPLSGGTVSGGTQFTVGLTANTISATTYQNLPPSTFSGGTVTGPTNFTNGLTATTISATTYQNLPTDVRVTGGTYSAGTITFTNNTGGTFNVTGLTTGSTSTVSGNFLPLSGGTVTGNTSFTSGVTAKTISATTYQNLPTDIRVTGATYSNNTFTYTNNTGGTFSTLFNTVTGLTVNGGLTITGNTSAQGLTATTISATTYQNLPTDIRVTGGTYSAGTISFTNNTGGTFNVTGLTTGSTSTVSGNFLPLSGGTVTGGTIFTSGLTANTLNVTGLTQTKGITSTGGITFKQVTINSSYTATTDDYMIDVTGGTFTVSLPTAVGIQGRLLVVKNNGGGAVTVDPFGSETIDGKPFVILGETNTIQLSSNGTEWVALSYNISTVNSSTGVFEFTGMTIASPTTFNVAPIKGWIVDDTTNPLSPQLYYVTYSGGTHTATYVTATTATWIYLTSGGTISQSNIPITDQQRRQNISLGKLGHANKTNIINAFSQPDFVLSPLAQLRDMFEPINLINGGIKTSANGANLSFNTSAGYLHGLGINFANDTLTPNSLYVTGTAPCTFQYRTQTGGTASNTTFIDPTKKDVGGVVTTLSGTKATNQRIYLVQNGVFRVQYGQVEYSNLTQAIAGIATEQFVEFTNFTTNGILIGVLSVSSTATDLTDTAKAQFFNVSKFGDSTGAAGGSPTTNLQQAYNNSTTPEITTNSSLGPLSVKNGAGTLDNVTNVFEGVNAAGTTTSFVRADGVISGTSIFGIGLSATTITATTYQNLPNSLRGLYLPTSGGTVSGNTIFTQNISVTGGTGINWFSGNTSTDLLRVTQTGTGNAFVVEDSSNPDGTPFVITNDGSVGIGTDSPEGRLNVVPAIIPSSTSNLGIKVEIGGSGSTGVAIVVGGSGTTTGLSINSASSNSTANGIIVESGVNVFNEVGNATSDFRIEGDTDPNLFFVDASADAVGIDQSTPTARLHIGSGTTAAGTSPLKFTTGSLMTTPETGSVEFANDGLYFSNVDGRYDISMYRIDRITSNQVFQSNSTFTNLMGVNISGDSLNLVKVSMWGGTSSTPGIKIRLVYSGGTIGTIDGISRFNNGTANITNGTAFEATEVNTAGASITNGWFEMDMMFSATTGGKIWVQGAQSVSDGAPTTFYRGGYIQSTFIQSR